MMSLTKQQEKAIATLDRDLCVTAGAGSGKTLVLARRYMEILRAGRAEVPGIVAITFTEKAAREMRERIRKYCDEIIEESVKRKDAEGVRKWRGHKRDLERARISTIHGFCSGILRENPVEAGVDPAFGVLDENAATILTAQVVDEGFENLLESENRHLQRLIEHYGVRHAKGILRFLLEHTEEMNSALDFFAKHDNRQLLETYGNRLLAQQAQFARELAISEDWKRKIEFLSKYSSSVEADKINQARLQVIKANLAICSATTDAEAANALKGIFEISLRGGSKRNWASDKIMEAVKETIDALREKIKKKKAFVLGTIDDTAFKAIDLARDVAKVYLEVLKLYGATKDEASALSFDDLEIKTRDLLKNNETVRGELQNGMRFILVDEFQDINPIQKEIISLLSGRQASKKAAGAPNVFFVGDDKQSIYRFRGADVEVFTGVRKEIGEKGRIVLDKNFRTVQDGVEFANVLFGKVMSAERATRGYFATYDDIKPHREPLDGATFAELSLLKYNKENNPVADRLRLMEARSVARKIRELASPGGALVYDDQQKEWITPQYRHIAVLFRALKGRVHAYERAFREADIPCHISAGSDFYARQEVTDVLNMLRLIDNPADDYALAGVLRSPMFSMSDESLYRLSMPEEGSFAQKFYSGNVPGEMPDEEREKLAFARRAIPSLSALKGRAPLPQIIRRILEVTGLEAVLAAFFNGAQKIANIRKMTEVARSFESSGIFSMRDFIKYIDEFITQEMRESQAPVEEEEQNVVRIMTVHKAKGLEFPIVIMPDICPQKAGHPHVQSAGLSRDLGLALRLRQQPGEKEPSNAIFRLWEFDERSKDLAESRRLLYVAATRAKDRLVLSACLKRGEEPHGWLEEIADALSLDVQADKVESSLPQLAVKETDIFEYEKAPPERASSIKTVIRALENVRPDESAAASPEGRRVSEIAPSLRAKRAFNPTELVDYSHCPRKYRFQFVCGHPQIRESGETGAVPGVVTGTIAHRLFENLRPEAREEQILEAIRAEGELAESQTREIAATLRGFVEKFDASPPAALIAGAAEIWREVSFVTRCGDALIEGKMDLMFRDRSGALHVLDYKSDVVEGGDFAVKLRHYRLQMAAYVLGAEAALGERPQSARLYFLRYGAEAELPISDKALEEYRREILRVIEEIRADRFDRRAGPPCACGYEWLCGADTKTEIQERNRGK